jgi:hypothetical protein
LNKEILVLFASVVTAKYVISTRKSILFFMTALGVSFLVRWEQALIFVLFVSLMRSPLRPRPKLMLGSVIFGLSILYPLIFHIFGIDPEIFSYLGEGANTILRLNNLQASGGFFIVVLPKIFMNMAGNLGQPWLYWSGDFMKGGFTDPQQQLFQPLGCLAFLLVFAYAISKRKLQLSRPFIMLMVLTMIVTAITPFIQPRYLYAAYVFLCLELAMPRHTPVA